MKTISKRFLKGGLAVLLAVLMLFGSTLTGFAAVVDNADTSANVDVAQTGYKFSSGTIVYFDSTDFGWPSNYVVEFMIGHNTWSATYQMTKISNTNLYYYKFSGDWDNCTQYCIIANASAWGDEGNSPSHRRGYASYKTSLQNINGNYSGTFLVTKSNESCVHQGSAYSSVNKTQTIYVVSTAAGGTTYSNDANAGTVELTGRYLSAATTASSRTIQTTLGSSYSANDTFAPGATMTLTATANTGYTFKGWYNDPSGGSLLSSSASYTTTHKGSSNNYYARFEKAPTYTATFEDWDGKNLKTESNLASGATPTPPTNPTREGYTFTGWDPTVGPINANTTYTAQYEINQYTATFEDWDGTVIKEQTLDYGKTPTAPANPSRTGYTFTGWSPTVGAISADTTYTATYTKNNYNVTFSENGGTGTVSANPTSATMGDSVAISVTPPDGKKISSITGGGLNVGECESYTGSITMPASNVTINVTYVDAGSCAPHFAYGDQSLVLGQEFTNEASSNEFCGNGGFTYNSSAPSIVSVDASGKIKALAVGEEEEEVTITATCKSDGTQASYKVTVKAPSVTVPAMTLAVNANGTAAPTVTNEPTSNVSYSYTTSATGITVGETNGLVNAYVPGTYTVNVALKYDGAQVATTSFNVTVNTPAFSIRPLTDNLIVGQTMTADFETTSTPAAQLVTLASADTSKVTISGNKATAVAAAPEGVTITASFKFNDSYTAYATAKVIVAEPEITANPTSVALEFGGGTTTSTVTLDTNAAVGNGTDDNITVQTANANVATATLSGNTITITATGTGSTTVTAQFHDAEVEIPVTVTQYDPNVTIYVTDTQDWGKMNIYFWEGNASSTHASMIYIGRNEQNQRVFAYKFDKTKLPGKIIFKQGEGSNDWTNQTDDQTFDISTNNAWYIASCSNNRSTVGRWNCPITLPTVSVNDVSLGIGDTDTVEATATGAGSYSWSTASSAIATVSGTTIAPTVEGKGAGETTLTVRAFIPTPTGWKSIASDQSTAYPYISSTAEATVTVSDVLYTVNVNAQYSNDGTTYVDGTTGGTVTVNGKDGVDTEVSHGKTATLVATANDGYRFVGWYKNGGQVGTATAMTTVAITADTTYTARFVKTYNVVITKPDTIARITYNNVEHTEAIDTTVDANATINFSVTPAQGNIFSHYVISGINGPIYDSSYSITVDSDVTITPVTVPACTASAQAYTNKVDSAIGGTATVNGESFVELANGATATFVATANTNYYFAGWYSDATFTNRVSTNATYSVDMTSDSIALHALFVKNFYLANHNTNEHLVTFTYDIATNTYTSTDTDFVNGFYVISDDNEDIVAPDVVVSSDNFTGITSIGGRYESTGYYLNVDSANYDSTKPVTYTLTPNTNVNGTYYLNITLQEATKYDVYFSDQGTNTLVDSKAERTIVTIPCTSPVDGQYLASATATPATNLTIGDNEITFEMPSEPIYITPTFLDYRYISFTDETGLTIENFKEAYKQGEEVTITVEPASEQVTISGFTFDAGDLTATENADGSWSITGVMPAGEDIEITPIVEAKFAVNSQQVSIGNYGTGVTVFGTVTMTDENGDTLNEGAYVEAGTSVTYTVTNVNSNYTFVGFYSDYSCDQAIKVGSDLTSVTVNADTTVYALFARKQWMTFDQSKTTGDYVKELVYDPSIKAYTLTTTLTDQDSSATAINLGAWFRVTNNTSKWGTSRECYHNFDGSKFSVNFNGHGYGATIGWAGNNSNAWILSTSAESGQSIKFILTPDGNESIDFSAMTTKEGATIYLSSGALTLPGTYSAESVFTTTGITVSESATLNDLESYKKADIAQAQMIEFKTTLTGDSAADYYVDSFIVYDILDRTYTIVTPNTLGNNEYSGTVFVDSDCYIVPIYFHTDEYLEANNMKAVDVYFDATAIADTNWGPFVSVYSWGSEDNRYSGVWPGQLMIPTEDGSSFYTQLEVPDTSVEGYTSVPQGLQFMNYLFSGDNGPLTVPSKFAANFGVTLNPIQTYDYREPITIIEEGYDVITFVAKTSEDGYHGDRGSGQSVTKTVTNETNAKTAGYVYDTLVSRDGVTPMDLTGQPIEGAVPNTPEYYVIAKGDILYDPASNTYAGDTNFDADWAVDWYIFNSEGTYLTHTLSTAMWHYADGENDTTSELEDALGLADGVLDGKLVYISYEAPNNAGHQLSYDGQWYANKLDDDVYADVMVGLVDGDNNFVIDTVDPTNDAVYGEGWIVAQEEREGYTVGEKYPSLPISLDLGTISLTAATKEGYLFVGWYTESNGKYTKISDAYDYETYINMNGTYYAMFREIGEGQVVINHLKYNNPTDTVIPSHGGMATMTVEVRDSGGNVLSSGAPSTDISTAVFPATEKQTYTITITTTPLMNGEFFAWYTDSFDDAGNKTFEEIGTDGSYVGSTETVTFTYDFTFENDSPTVINLYSDVTRVTNKADFYYRYLNRFGEWRTYTVRDIELSDDECLGYAGNENNAYYPTYLTKYTYEGGSISYGKTPVSGKTVINTENKIQEYAPNADVTEVFDGTVSWSVESATITPGKSIITIIADQGKPEYTITYEMGDEAGTVTGVYNTLVDDIEPIVAPSEYNGLTFSYWVEIDPVTGEETFLSYQKNYSYRIVENKNIKAIYGAENVPDWTPSIDSVTYTREFSDNSDVIYTDFLLAFNSKNGLKLNEVKAEQNIKYGLIMVQDPNESYDGPGDELIFPEYNELNLEKSALAGRNGLIGGNRYYNFDLTNLELTNFNRCDYFKSYDNNDTTNNFKSVAYTCVAYMNVDGTVYLSSPQYVNFYDLAVTDYSLVK